MPPSISEASPAPSADQRAPHRVLGALDFDIVVKILSKTIFSPFFVIFLPMTFLSKVHSTHPVFVISCIWAAIICSIGIWNHLDRTYANQTSLMFAPPRIVWTDQIVLITGGGSGIGALLAQTLAMRNVAVVVLTKDEPKNDPNNNIYTYTCDVSDYKEVEKVAARIRQEVGEPTVIVNNAGVVKGKLLLDLTENDIKDTFGSNALAHFWVLKAFLPAMLRAGAGHVVTMSSILGVVGAAQMTDYCASKAAVISLHQALRFELDNRYQRPAIRTTLVLPAFTLTTLFDRTKFPSSRLFTFFCPPVQPHTIVKKIIEALDENESRIMRLPYFSNFARFAGDTLGLVPAWMRDLAQWLLGADHAMSEYGPKPDAGERLAAERLQQKKQPSD